MSIRTKIHTAIFAMLCSYAAGNGDNCPNGQPQLSGSLISQTCPGRKSGSVWYFTATGLVSVGLNCDVSPCITQVTGGGLVHSSANQNCCSWEGQATPADPWCDEGDTRIITIQYSGGSDLKPDHAHWYINGDEVL